MERKKQRWQRTEDGKAKPKVWRATGGYHRSQGSEKGVIPEEREKQGERGGKICERRESEKKRVVVVVLGRGEQMQRKRLL